METTDLYGVQLNFYSIRLNLLERQTTSAEGPGQEAKRPISGLPGDPVMSLDPEFPEMNLTETVIHIISTSQIRVKGKRGKLGDF